MDHHAVIWTRYLGTPKKLASMVLMPSELRITKTPEAIAAGLPGVSFLHDLAGLHQLNYPRTYVTRLPPQLRNLLPPANPGNPQRLIWTRALARTIDLRGMDAMLQEWHLLLLAGRNGLGHLDVFADDDAARAFYSRPALPQIADAAGASLWHAFRRLAENDAVEEDVEAIIDAVGPTPGVSGFVPKLLVPIQISAADNRWSGAMFGAGATPAIVKIGAYPGIVDLEELAYAFHRRAGIDTPRTWTTTLNHQGQALRLLAVERFDRDAQGWPIPVETICSLLQTGNPNRYLSTTDGTMETVAEVLGLDRLTANPTQQKQGLFQRLVMALLTGNGDLHTENMALYRHNGVIGQTPVFDPAPMRAYRGYPKNHDLLSALPFDGIGGANPERYNPYADSGSTPPDLRQHVLAFGKAIGLSSRYCAAEVARLCEVTADFAAQAEAMMQAIPAHAQKPHWPAIGGFQETIRKVRAALDSVRR